MKRLLVCAAVLFAVVGCNRVEDLPTDPSQVNIEFTTSDLVVGTGAQAAQGNRATVQYIGWLYNPAGVESKGSQFDSSYTSGVPADFIIGAGTLIQGFELGTLGMRVGGKRRVYIPSSLAFGNLGAGGGRIPPGAALVFELELVNLTQ